MWIFKLKTLSLFCSFLFHNPETLSCTIFKWLHYEEWTAWPPGFPSGSWSEEPFMSFLPHSLSLGSDQEGFISAAQSFQYIFHCCNCYQLLADTIRLKRGDFPRGGGRAWKIEMTALYQCCDGCANSCSVIGSAVILQMPCCDAGKLYQCPWALPQNTFSTSPSQEHALTLWWVTMLL